MYVKFLKKIELEIEIGGGKKLNLWYNSGFTLDKATVTFTEDGSDTYTLRWDDGSVSRGIAKDVLFVRSSDL